MKQFFLTFSLLIALVIGSASAQITITQADLPTIGLQVIRAVDNTTQINPGNPGLNQVWDFTNLVPSVYDTTLYLPPQGQINYQNYPDADVAVKHLNGNPPPYWDYEYIRYTDQGIRYVGDEDMITIFGDFTMTIHITCNPNPLSLQLPFTYGNQFTQESTYEWHMVTRNAGQLMDSIKQISHMNITTTGDASGMMMTPYGSFPVLRVKTDIISQDSVFNWTTNGWVFYSFDISSYSNYRWYANDYYEVGLYQFEEGKGNTMTFFKSETVVGTSVAPFTNNYSVFPNPSTDVLTIQGAEIPERVEIYNTSGKMVLSDSNSTTLKVSGLPSGLYFLRIHSGKNITPLKFVKE
jgi:hypothetical protein